MFQYPRNIYYKQQHLHHICGLLLICHIKPCAHKPGQYMNMACPWFNMACHWFINHVNIFINCWAKDKPYCKFYYQHTKYRTLCQTNITTDWSLQEIPSALREDLQDIMQHICKCLSQRDLLILSVSSLKCAITHVHVHTHISAGILQNAHTSLYSNSSS